MTRICRPLSQDGDPESLVTTVASSVLSVEESQYIINKLITMTVSQATLAAQKQASIAELENRMKQVGCGGSGSRHNRL